MKIRSEKKIVKWYGNVLESAIKSCWREIKEVVVMRATAYEASCMSILGRCIQGMIGNARCSLKRRSKIDRQNEKSTI